MNVALRPSMTLEQYLEWEEHQETKHEFDGSAPVAMTGARRAHVRIAANLVTALVVRLRGRPCEAYSSDLKLLVGKKARYPDAMVVCTPISNDAAYVTNPTVVFEILSHRTASIDRFTKAAEYWTVSSISHYVILEQTKAAAVILNRGPDGWRRVVVPGTGAIDLPAIGLSLPLAELYDGLTFPQPEPPEEAQPPS